MSYTVKRIIREPVVVANISGVVDTATIQHIFTQSSELLAIAEGPWCHITYFLNNTIMDADNIYDFAAIIADSMSRTVGREAPVFYVFIGQQPEVEQLAQLLAERDFQIPVFPSIDETMSYVRVKLDSSNLRQSLLKPDTHDLHKTLHRKPIDLPAKNGKRLGTSHFPAYGLLKFEAVELNRSLSHFPHKGLMIGRRDSKGYRPDVDFSLWQGYYSGISRRHAEIELEGDHLYLIDLHSANGTFLNGHRLQPERRYLLHDGDELCFGHLQVRIYFERQV